MSIIWAETFNKYGTNTALMLNGLYAQVYGSNLVTDPDPSATGKVFQTATLSLTGILLRRIFNGSKSAAGMSFRLWLANLPPNNNSVPTFTFLDAGSNPAVSMTVDTIGRIYVSQGDGSGTVLGVSSTPVVTANAWNHIEFKAVAGVSGTFEVRVNGTPILTGTGNTGSAYYQFGIHNSFAAGGNTLTYYVKDLVAWDTTGSFNNNFLGSCQVIDLLPNADVSFNWTPSSGTTGYNRINIVPPLDDGSYISAPFPIPSASLFDVANLPSTATSVKALITETRVRKTDGGDGNVQVGLKSGASTGLGVDRPITTAYTYYEDVFETDPATGAAWTISAANAVNLRINRTV